MCVYIYVSTLYFSFHIVDLFFFYYYCYCCCCFSPMYILSLIKYSCKPNACRLEYYYLWSWNTTQTILTTCTCKGLERGCCKEQLDAYAPFYDKAKHDKHSTCAIEKSLKAFRFWPLCASVERLEDDPSIDVLLLFECWAL